jgi:hypothetical protein
LSGLCKDLEILRPVERPAKSTVANEKTEEEYERVRRALESEISSQFVKPS